MRLLVGHTNQMPELLSHSPLPGRARRHDDILAFGNGYTQVRHEPGMDWEALLANCPKGWQPDVYIHWSVEYNAIPRGLENADCLTVGVVGDWNLGGQALHRMGGAFDALFADRNGCEVLRRAGYADVHYAPLWAFHPSLHRRLPNIARDIDVLMIGNFNHSIQNDRARRLARVAKLSTKHRVVFTTGVFGEEYAHMMNRAKIVFNRSIRGEINMRAYEAPACGALMFYEAENTEIRDMFTDREHCVLYDDSNLESLLEYYLAPANAPERDRIAEAAWWRLREHTYAYHFAGMLNAIEPMTEAKQRGETVRSLRLETPRARTIRRASQWLTSCDRRIYPTIDRELSCPDRTDDGAEANPAEEAELCNAKAVLQAEWASCLPASPERSARFQAALNHAQAALHADPTFLMAKFNLGSIALHAGLATEGERVLTEVAEALADPNLSAAQLRGVYFPRRFESLDVEIERIWGAFAPGSTEWCAGIRTALECHIHMILAGRASSVGNSAEFAKHAEAAARARPNFGDALLLFARALSQNARRDEAIVAYRNAIAVSPFLFDAWAEAAQLLIAGGRSNEAKPLLEEILAVLNGMPFYGGMRGSFETLWRQAATASAPTAAPKVARMLAFPHWDDAAHWQAIVRAFVEEIAPANPSLLLLRVDPRTAPPAETLLECLETFLTGDLGLDPAALPDITLFNQPLSPEEMPRLFAVADAVLTWLPSDLSGELRALAGSARLPILSLQEMSAMRAA